MRGSSWCPKTRHCAPQPGQSPGAAAVLYPRVPIALAADRADRKALLDRWLGPRRSIRPPAHGRRAIRPAPRRAGRGCNFPRLPPVPPVAGRPRRPGRCHVRPAAGKTCPGQRGASARGEATLPGHLPWWVGVGGEWKDEFLQTLQPRHLAESSLAHGWLIWGKL